MVNNNMSRALRLVSVERGRDPREYTLIAFGGAGPLHACDLAGELRIRRIIVPVHPGLFSAFGLLTSEVSRTFVLPILNPATASIEQSFTRLRAQARESLQQESFRSYQTIEQVDLRYQGQSHEITVPYRILVKRPRRGNKRPTPRSHPDTKSETGQEKARTVKDNQLIRVEKSIALRKLAGASSLQPRRSMAGSLRYRSMCH